MTTKIDELRATLAGMPPARRKAALQKLGLDDADISERVAMPGRKGCPQLYSIRKRSWIVALRRELGDWHIVTGRASFPLSRITGIHARMLGRVLYDDVSGVLLDIRLRNDDPDAPEERGEAVTTEEGFALLQRTLPHLCQLAIGI